MTFLFLILTGLLVGVLAPVFGVGGGILIVPALHTFFSKLPAQSIIGCSLFTICINSIINSWNFKRAQVKISPSIASTLCCSMALGVIIGGQIGLGLAPGPIKLIFASTALLVAIKSVFYNKSQSSPLNGKPDTSFWLKALLTGLIAGLVSGLTGLGGGAVLVPLMISLLALPLNMVSPYSQAAMAFATLCGSVTYILAPTPNLAPHLRAIQSYQFGHVNLVISGLLVLGSMCTSRLGVRLSRGMSQKLSKKLFAWLLTIISLRIFYSELF